jgi:hypothetical protein
MVRVKVESDEGEGDGRRGYEGVGSVNQLAGRGTCLGVGPTRTTRGRGRYAVDRAGR